MEPTGNMRGADSPPAPPESVAEAQWLARLDTDHDGRVSRDEYTRFMLPNILWQGIPADWGGWARRPS